MTSQHTNVIRRPIACIIGLGESRFLLLEYSVEYLTNYSSTMFIFILCIFHLEHSTQRRLILQLGTYFQETFKDNSF